MDLLAQIPLIGPLISTVLPFLLVLGVVVFVHEYGHYIVGRWCGIGAEVFSIGFGRELFGWTDRRGTRWRVAALPLGGYVKFLGDSDASSAHADPVALARLSPGQRTHAFHLASVERRALTVAAGPIANFLLSIVIFAAVALWQGRAVDEPVIGQIGPGVNPEFAQALAPGDRVLAVDGRPVDSFAALSAALTESEGREVPVRVARGADELSVAVAFRPAARVDAVAPGGAADEAGLRAGDLIEAVDGEAVAGFSDLQRRVFASQGVSLALTVRRGDERLSLDVTPRMTETADPVTGETVLKPLLGVQKLSTEIAPPVEPVGPLSALAVGAERTWMVISVSLSGLAQVVTGAQDAREVLGGPVRIAEVSGEAAADGLGTFIGLIAVLSASIGLINLFPVPILDGGHLMFYAFEKLRGRPLRERWQEIGNGIGLALVLSLMIFATLNDLSRL
jgi:regulator of sigma E protease